MSRILTETLWQADNTQHHWILQAQTTGKINEAHSHIQVQYRMSGEPK